MIDINHLLCYMYHVYCSPMFIILCYIFLLIILFNGYLHWHIIGTINTQLERSSGKLPMRVFWTKSCFNSWWQPRELKLLGIFFDKKRKKKTLMSYHRRNSKSILKHRQHDWNFGTVLTV